MKGLWKLQHSGRFIVTLTMMEMSENEENEAETQVLCVHLANLRLKT